MKCFADKFRVEDVPLWVTFVVALSFPIGVSIGVPALLGNGWQETWGIGWGGREIGISVGALIA